MKVSTIRDMIISHAENYIASHEPHGPFMDSIIEQFYREEMIFDEDSIHYLVYECDDTEPMKYREDFLVWYFYNYMENHLLDRIVAQGIIKQETDLINHVLAEGIITSFECQSVRFEKEGVNVCEEHEAHAWGIYARMQDGRAMNVGNIQGSEQATILTDLLNSTLNHKTSISFPRWQAIMLYEAIERKTNNGDDTMVIKGAVLDGKPSIQLFINGSAEPFYTLTVGEG